MTPRGFIEAYGEAAIQNQKAYGVPWQVTLAQAALESGWGRFASRYNFFGVKADPSWTGQVQELKTREVVNGKDVWIMAKFRAYNNAKEGFEDHAKFLRKWKRYASAFLTNDPREFARRVAAAGYATDPGYATSLVAIIDIIEKVAREMDWWDADLPVKPPAAEPSIFKRILGWFR